MEPKTKSLFISTMTYGLYLGIVLVIYSVLLFIFGIMPIGFVKPMLLGLVSLTIYVVGIILSTKKVRAELYQGQVTYGQAFVIGFLVAITAAIIGSLYSYIQNAFIDPDYMVRYMTAQKEWTYNFMASKGVSQDQIDSALEKFDEQIKNTSSLKTLFKGLAGSIFFGLIISLITSAFLKKKTTPFENPNV